MFRFEDLKVWHRAAELYDATDELVIRLPRRQGELASQLLRAALSVSSNIAEGSGRETQKDFKHFLTMAKGSVYEVASLVMIGRRRGVIAEDQYRDLYQRAEEIAKMLTALKRPRTPPEL
jgi:four helix bundle protein